MNLVASILEKLWVHYSTLIVVFFCLLILFFVIINRNNAVKRASENYNSIKTNINKLSKDIKSDIEMEINSPHGITSQSSHGINIPESYQPSTDPRFVDKSMSKGEAECKRVIEEIFGKPFNKSRPAFLLNDPTSDGKQKNYLELDCFNPELRLAIEYNGIQHYKYTPYFHKTVESFTIQKYRDYIKKQLCKENGVRLIEVPYTVQLQDIKSFIISELYKKASDI